MRRNAVFAVCAAAAAAALCASACGMRPPREYHEVEKAQGVDVSPLPAPEAGDAGVAEDADASVDGPGMGVLPIVLPWAAVPALTIAQLLGKTRAEIDSLKAPLEPATREERAELKRQAKEGWIRYTTNLRVRFDEGQIAVEIEQQVPPALSCVAAARWLGFADAAAPAETEAACTWDASGERALGGGASGALDRATSLFRAARPAPQAE